MSVPPKYARLGDFADYYSGEKKAPVLTVFVGGNHEASNYMWELFYGGWVAPNIYYLGAANVINFKGIRIGGMSGIYNEHHYSMGHYELIPYRNDTKRSVYHVRQFDVMKLYQISSNVDIMISHDWPAGIEHKGDLDRLLKRKPHFKSDVSNNELGSPPAMTLLKHIRPKYWLSAHLHIKYAAIVKHKKKEKLEENDTASRDQSVSTAPAPREVERQGLDRTNFLALDKCLPRREFLQALKFPRASEVDDELCFDPEWLAITKATEPYMSLEREQPTPFQSKESRDALTKRIQENREWVEENIVKTGRLRIPKNFQMTAQPVKNRHSSLLQNSPQRKFYFFSYQYYSELTIFWVKAIEYKNNQTQEFCDLLQIQNRIYRGHYNGQPSFPESNDQQPDDIEGEEILDQS